MKLANLRQSIFLLGVGCSQAYEQGPKGFAQILNLVPILTPTDSDLTGTFCAS